MSKYVYNGKQSAAFYRGTTYTKGEAVEVDEATAARLADNPNFKRYKAPAKKADD